ncbi:MAG: sulfatase/phosphatase domain-containing protein, partial [Planctomycetota bacterium]
CDLAHEPGGARLRFRGRRRGADPEPGGRTFEVSNWTSYYAALASDDLDAAGKIASAAGDHALGKHVAEVVRTRVNLLAYESAMRLARELVGKKKLKDALGECEKALEAMPEDEGAAAHGDYMGEHGLYAKGLPCFRGAYHVPLVVRWPEGIAAPGRTVDDLVSLADVAPTLLEAVGIEKVGSAAEQELVGRSLMPFLTSERDGPPDDWRDMLFTQSNGNELYGIQRAAFDKEWKLVYNGFDYDELYDLRADPHETQNVARDPANREIVSRMMGRIWRFAREAGDKCVNPYIMVRFAQYGPAHAFR